MEERDDMLIEQIAQTLRDEPMQRLSPSFDARVMASIKWSEPQRPLRAALAWFMRPRRLSISPVGGLAFAAAFAGFAYFGAGAAVRSMMRQLSAPQGELAASASATTAAQAADASRQIVQFVLVAPGATSVSLVGDFNDWNATATPLNSPSGNLWTVQVPLTPGRYNYVFLIDGTRFMIDPSAPTSPVDEFGQKNSVITVGGSAS